MRIPSSLFFFLAVIYSSSTPANELQVPSLDPRNQEFLTAFCAYHSTSDLCFFKPELHDHDDDDDGGDDDDDDGGGDGGPLAVCNKLPICPSPDKVDVWSVPPDGGSTPKGSPDRVLLMVANSVITGPINAREVRYKGVIMIGATFQMRGRQYANGPTGTPVPGGNVLTITFAQGIASPFIFLANIDYHVNPSYWGDFIRTGTKLNASKNNFSEWVDVSLSNTRIDGHFFWSSSSPGMAETTHSDIFQSANGGWRSLAVCNVETAWTGQGFYVVPTRASPNAHPDGLVTLDNVAMGPKANSRAFYGGGHHDVKYVAAFNGNVNPGNYYRVRLHNVYFRPHDSQTLPSMYGPGFAFTGTPVLTSSPPTVIDAGQLGAAGRVSNAADLHRYCGP